MSPATSTSAASRPEPTADPADLVLHLDAVGAEDTGRSGAKAARLAQLTRVGFAVPRGFVITSAASQAFARLNGITASTPAEHVSRAAMPPNVETDIRRALEAFRDTPVAVRSSSVAEDQAGASFAGIYESILDVSGPEAVLDAVRRVWASAHDARVRSYQVDAAGCAAMSVLVQAMVRADVAGVAFSADPVTGDRDVVVVSAIRGVGERLVSGTASAEEWRVKGSQPTRLRNDEVLNVETVLQVAELARRLESLACAPQDIEWAVEDGQLLLLQARPLTAVPEAVSWSVPWGGWVRNFRLGEWIGDPVTPSFESWLLTGIEEGMHGHLERLTGWPMPRPFHCIVNGWYYYGLNLVEPGTSRWQAFARIPTIIGRVSRNLRAVAGVSPPTAHLGFDWGVREWREQLLPATQELVRRAEREVNSASATALVGWIDQLAANAGRNFASVIGVSGYSAKAEFALARFWAKHLSGIDGSWLELVRTGDAAAPAVHDVQGGLQAPLILGELPGLFKTAFAQMEQALFEGRAPESDEIRGMPGSPGRATGPVKVIRSVADVVRLKPGDVLVTAVTTPAWTPAFSIVAAIVTDTGSVASHASVVAREYGLPAVVGTGNATTRLRDGDVVTVDGAKATVRVVQAIES